MKKIYSFFLLFLLTGAVFAQQSHEIKHLQAKEIQFAPATPTGKTAGTVDTIFDYLDRSTAFYLLSAGAGGYTLGTNSFTTETGVHYSALGITSVRELMVFFTHKEVMFGAADSLVAKFYSSTADSVPDSLLGMGKVSVADIDTSGFATFITLQNPDSTNGDFFVAIDFDDNNNIDDTVAILSNNVLASNNGPDGQGERRTRQKISNGSWLSVWDIWNFGGSPMDADAMILPIVDYTVVVGVQPEVRSDELHLHPVYPQPAEGLTHIPFSLDRPQRVALTLFDAQGRPVGEFSARSFAAGRSGMDVDTGGLAAGVYYFRLQAERGVLAGKFWVK